MTRDEAIEAVLSMHSELQDAKAEIDKVHDTLDEIAFKLAELAEELEDTDE